MTAMNEAARTQVRVAEEGESLHLGSVVDAVERIASVYRSSGADDLELEYAGLVLRFSKHEAQTQMIQGPFPASQVVAPAVPNAAEAILETDVSPAVAESVDPDVAQVKAPLVGVFYAAPAPDADPFVTEGQSVRKGDVLCIVEAMKFMNEITAPCDGVVESISALNGQPLAFDEIIMTIRS